MITGYVYGIYVFYTVSIVAMLLITYTAFNERLLSLHEFISSLVIIAITIVFIFVIGFIFI